MIEKTIAIIREILVQNNIPFELLFVNDGSKDATWPAILHACAEDARVKGISFSRNFGKEAAIFAGLSKAAGNCAVVIDCDLQHPPEKIVEMYRLWQQGYQVVEGVKESRGKESVLHRWFAQLFYSLISAATGIDMANASDFKLMDRTVISVLNAMPERNTFFRALSSWVGFRSTQVLFQVQERREGESKWSVPSLFRYAINNITSFSAFPLQFVTIMGVMFLLFSTILGIQTIVNKVQGGALGGFTTVIMVELIVGSICMLSIGIMGLYIAKIYDEIKGRPRYICSEEMNIHETKDSRDV